MKEIVRKFCYDLILIFINYIVAYIPSWLLRKFIYKIFGMKIGKGSRINQRVFVYAPWRISIGNNSIINTYCIIDGRGGLQIGSNTSISMRTVIYSASHISSSNIFEYYKRHTEIGDCCWLGVGSVILPGSNLADRTIIGANSVYKGKSKEGGIYSGNPAIFVRDRCLDKNYKLEICEYFT